jgi:NAD(P)-dependent dehydrogenase (short-subunit alcohol dehydrogenase family)
MAAMKKELRGQVAVVTGGSRGIGLGIARALTAAGVNVAITGRDARSLAAAQQQLERAGAGAVLTVRMDVRAASDVQKAIGEIVTRFGGLDIVVNNAGIGTFVGVADMTHEQWAGVIDTNLTGVFNVCHAALPVLRQRGGGYVINISSLAGKNAFVGAAAYCASKAGLNAFSETLMQEVRHDNIRVTCLAPGSVATDFSGDAAKGAEWKISPDDIGDIVRDLLEMDARSLSSYIELRPSKPPKK